MRRLSSNFRRACTGLAAVLLLALPQAANAEAPPLLRMCLPDLEATPFLNAVGRPPGLVDRILLETARQTGVTVRISRAPIRRCILQLQQGEIDGMIAGWSPANQEMVRFPMKGEALDPGRRLVRVSTVWVQRRNAALKWDGEHFSSGNGEPITVGTLRAVSVVANALQLQGYKLEDTAGSIHQLLQQLRIGRVDAVVGLIDQIQREFASGQFDDLEILPATALQRDFYAGFRHARFAASPALIERFWDRLALVRELPEFQPAR